LTSEIAKLEKIRAGFFNGLDVDVLVLWVTQLEDIIKRNPAMFQELVGDYFRKEVMPGLITSCLVPRYKASGLEVPGDEYPIRTIITEVRRDESVVDFDSFFSRILQWGSKIAMESRAARARGFTPPRDYDLIKLRDLDFHAVQQVAREQGAAGVKARAITREASQNLFWLWPSHPSSERVLQTSTSRYQPSIGSLGFV
jgi:hypothetical protein